MFVVVVVVVMDVVGVVVVLMVSWQAPALWSPFVCSIVKFSCEFRKQGHDQLARS